MSRSERAAEILSAMMTNGEEDWHILVGPDVGEKDLDERLDIHPLMETSVASIVSALADDFRIALPAGRVSGETGREVLGAVLRHVVDKGEILRERDDGITLYACPSPDTAGWVIAQIAVGNGVSGDPEIAGIYHHTSLLVLDDFRGRGIGSDLVVEHVLENGGVLNWDLDCCSYSPGGAAAHLAALRKLEELAREMSPEPSL